MKGRDFDGSRTVATKKVFHGCNQLLAAACCRTALQSLRLSRSFPRCLRVSLLIRMVLRRRSGCRYRKPEISQLDGEPPKEPLNELEILSFRRIGLPLQFCS